MNEIVRISIISITTYIFVLMSSVFGGSLKSTVTDDDGNPLEFAVVSLVSDDESLSFDNAIMPSPVMTQKNIQFNPFVLPVAAGTTVRFPNEDQVRHQVYSFSKVKRFELELYGKDEEKSVMFDTPGVVALGCNIHDNMLAYIYVARSKLFATTGENGSVSIENIPAGNYRAYVWHPRIKGDEQDWVQNVTIGEETNSLSFEISLKRERNRKRRTY